MTRTLEEILSESLGYDIDPERRLLDARPGYGGDPEREPGYRAPNQDVDGNTLYPRRV